LIFISIYFDEYRKSIAKRSLLDAVILRIENSESSIQFLLAILQPGINKDLFIKAAFLPSLLTLENEGFNCFFYPTQQLEHFIGGLVFLLGDHMGQIDLAHLPSPRCKHFMDRFLTIDSTQISTLTTDQTPLFVRDPIATYSTIKKALVAEKVHKKGKAKKYLKSVGLEGISVFWKLPLFRKNFFSRFPQDRLHLVLHGHIKTVFSFLALKKGWAFCLRFNSYIQNRKKSLPLEHLSKVFYIAKSKDPEAYHRFQSFRSTVENS
jgi:hypothetical protein